MHFSLSAEQTGLVETLSRFVTDAYTPENRAGMLAKPEGYDPECWKQLTDLGLVSLAISEEREGLGGSMVDLMLAAKAIGPGLVLDPWLPTIIACRVLERLGNDHQIEQWLSPLASADALLTFAHIEAVAGPTPISCEVTATRKGVDFLLKGRKLVGLGAGAETAMVSARMGDTEQVSLFLVPLDTPGVVARRFRLVDGSLATALDFSDTCVDHSTLVGEAGRAGDAMELTLAEGAVLLCAEAIGIMEAAMSATVEHLKTRKQFGVAIGTFQAVQHRMADCAAQIELAKGLTTKAAILHDAATASRSEKLAASYGAKAFISRTAKLVAEETVQFHGAIGITEELWVGRAMKRLLLIAELFGDERACSQMRDHALSQRRAA